MTLSALQLADMFTLERGRVYLTGVQALVRLLIDQRRRDQRAGLDTAGFVSGYRGSPLGGVDLALWRNQKLLDNHRITFQPGVNEELAATAVIGSQLTHLQPDPVYDGVFGLWYGKGPGLDRAGDAMKHLNALGTAPNGGVLVVAGDDHGAVSSSLAHQCEQVMASWMMPVLHPADVGEYIEFGLLGFAMSRFSGLAVGFKAISETVESAGVVTVDPDRPRIVIPEGVAMPPEGLHILSPEPQVHLEERMQRYRLPAAQAFARANRIDRLTLDSPGARVGIMTAGKAHLDVVQALADLGIDEARARALGLRVYKVGMVWPLEPEGAREFAAGLEEIIVVEEKRAVIETQLKDLLYGLPEARRPRIVGKFDETGAPLLPGHGELTPGMVARVVAARLGLGEKDGPARRHLEILDRADAVLSAPPMAVRPPYFCSGCPHNTSTKLPTGSRALSGTGCHLMAAFMDRETSVFLHMGCEGAAWLGMEPFVKSKHIFQNLGDGTYVHSGSLAIRQAVAAGVNITYKVLYNDAVAMTGGQPLEGGTTVPEMVQQIYHEGVARIAVVSDEPEKYGADAGFPPGVTVHHRHALDRVQREFREVGGVGVIVYDQTCAAEKRRRRKRGTFPDPAHRVFINDLVCEGCGDCNVQSNCLSVEPVETEFGRKRAINQSSCNKDYSCADGFCPSFVHVLGGQVTGGQVTGDQAGRGMDRVPDVPLPEVPRLTRPFGVLLTGIGGTGVITLGQLIGMAAFIDGLAVSVLDFTGLAQKGGGVLSHIRIGADAGARHPARIPVGGTDLLLAGDSVVAVGAEALASLRHGHSRAVVNAKAIPTATIVHDPMASLDSSAQLARLAEAVGEDRADFIDATDAAERLTGDAIGANIFLLGFAFQRGTLPVSLEALHRAIELNGVAVEANKRALAWGRLAAHDGAALEAVTGPLDDGAPPKPRPLDELISHRRAGLADYQNAAYAARYTELVARVRAAERALPGNPENAEALTRAVAVNFYKLMAYKDEYEVARLYGDGRFEASLKRRFGGDFKLRFSLAPPLWSRRDADSGHLVKHDYGPWMLSAFKLLARLKGLRGGWFDPFGYQAERRMERRLIDEYENDMTEVAAALTPGNHGLAVEIASLPDAIRGFGHVKTANAANAAARRSELMAALRGTPENPALAAE